MYNPDELNIDNSYYDPEWAMQVAAGNLGTGGDNSFEFDPGPSYSKQQNQQQNEASETGNFMARLGQIGKSVGQGAVSAGAHLNPSLAIAKTLYDIANSTSFAKNIKNDADAILNRWAVGVMQAHNEMRRAQDANINATNRGKFIRYNDRFYDISSLSPEMQHELRRRKAFGQTLEHLLPNAELPADFTSPLSQEEDTRIQSQYTPVNQQNEELKNAAADWEYQATKQFIGDAAGTAGMIAAPFSKAAGAAILPQIIADTKKAYEEGTWAGKPGGFTKEGSKAGEIGGGLLNVLAYLSGAQGIYDTSQNILDPKWQQEFSQTPITKGGEALLSVIPGILTGKHYAGKVGTVGRGLSNRAAKYIRDADNAWPGSSVNSFSKSDIASGLGSHEGGARAIKPNIESTARKRYNYNADVDGKITHWESSNAFLEGANYAQKTYNAAKFSDEGIKHYS